MSEVPDFRPIEYAKSALEVSSILLEAAQLCFTDTVSFVKSIPSRVDCWIADYGDEEI